MRSITQFTLCLLACASTLLRLATSTPIHLANYTVSFEPYFIEARAPISSKSVVRWISNAYSDSQTGWKAKVPNPLFAPLNYKEMTQGYARQVYAILQAKSDIANRDALLVACLYIPGKGWYISTEDFTGHMFVSKTTAPDWGNIVGMRQIYHAEDLACVMYETDLPTPPAPNTDYPPRSYMYIYGRFKVNEIPDGKAPCGSTGAATITPSCFSILNKLMVASDGNPNPSGILLEG